MFCFLLALQLLCFQFNVSTTASLGIFSLKMDSWPPAIIDIIIKVVLNIIGAINTFCVNLCSM